MSAFKKHLKNIARTERRVVMQNKCGEIRVAFNAADDDPVEISVCQEIGKDPWSGEGICLADIQTALQGVPRSRALNFLTNSPGGSVSEGTAIRNWLSGWSGGITNTIIGIAASTASWCIPANETLAYKSSQMFLHRSWGMVAGNADDMRQAIDFLEKTDGQIAQMLADQCDGDADEMMQMMKDETLLTGQDALNCGLVDRLIDGEAKNTFSADQLKNMKLKLAALNSIRPAQGVEDTQTKNKTELMNKEKMIALLKNWGVPVPDNATDEQLVKLLEAGKPAPVDNKNDPSAEIAALKATVDKLNASNGEAARARITAAVDKLIADDKLVAGLKDEAIKDLLANPDRLESFYNKQPARHPGVDPVGALDNSKLDVVSAAIGDICNGFERHNEATNAWAKGQNVKMETIRDASIAKANFFRKYQNRILEVMNTNTIATELKRQVILQEIIRDFVRRLLPLSMFSTVFQNIPLQGLNTVEVPFYDLDSSASTSFVSGTGYTTLGNTTTDKREITIGEGATNGDRLYQALAFSSQEIARQPYLNIQMLAKLKAEKLAADIFADVLSIITAANYGAAAVTKAAGLFNSDDLAVMKLACKAWPEMGRGLILDSAYDAELLKDPAFKYALNAASDSAIKEGRLYPRVMGFDYTENPNIPANGENLVGFAAFKSAILVATAPVPPVDEVRNAGTVWELVTDPQTGISFEYRRFGNNVTDAATNVIECSYGFAKGNGNALKRMTSA